MVGVGLGFLKSLESIIKRKAVSILAKRCIARIYDYALDLRFIVKVLPTYNISTCSMEIKFAMSKCNIVAKAPVRLKTWGNDVRHG